MTCSAPTATPPLQIVESSTNGTFVLDLYGVIDETARLELTRAVGRAAFADSHEVVLDLHGLTPPDLAAIRLLDELRRHAEGAGHRVSVLGHTACMTTDRPEPTQEELERGRRAFELLPQDHRFEKESAKLSKDDQRCVALYLTARLLGRG